MASYLTRVTDWWRSRAVARREAGGEPTQPGRGWRSGKVWKRTAVIVAFLLLVYYPIGMIWVHTVDDDTTFRAPEVPAGASHAVAVTAALINREIDVHRWTANDPWFLPPAALDNMPNFQQGIIAALSRLSIELLDQIGRTRGSSEADDDLIKAVGLLKYPGTVWDHQSRGILVGADRIVRTPVPLGPQPAYVL